jgi:phosphoribosylformimino-5-aminoimidazole carboxamide ribotide isomerase
MISKPALSFSSCKANALRSEDDRRVCWVRRFARFPKVQVIDLDAAMGAGDNLSLVKRIAHALTCRVGGGIRSARAPARCSPPAPNR